MAGLPLRAIVDVPALNVKLVVVPKLMPPLFIARVTVLASRFIVLTLVLLDDKVAAVTAYPAVVNVPFVTASVFDPMFNASASCTVPP